MPRANEIKKGMVLNYNGKLLIVKNIDIQSPSARGAATLYKMRFSDVRTGLKVEERFKGDDIVDTVTLTRRFVDFSYVDGNEYVFMDKEDYTPYTFTKEQIEEELQFIPEGGMPDMQVLTWDGQLEQRDRVLRFNRSIKLPVTLAEIGMAEADLQTVADKAATVLEWTKAPRPVTKEAFMQAMRDADAAGRALLAAEA